MHWTKTAVRILKTRLERICRNFSGWDQGLAMKPTCISYSQLSPEQQTAAGAGPDVVRLSIGIEDVADIIADLEQALDKA